MANEVPAEVIVPPGMTFGVFSNAFRIVEEVGPDCFLDFIVYSGQEGKAELVTRVRVRKQFLVALQSKLKEAIDQFADPFPPQVH